MANNRKGPNPTTGLGCFSDCCSGTTVGLLALGVVLVKLAPAVRTLAGKGRRP